MGRAAINLRHLGDQTRQSHRARPLLLSSNLQERQPNSVRKRDGIVGIALRDQHPFPAVVDNHATGAAFTSKNPEEPVTNKR